MSKERISSVPAYHLLSDIYSDDQFQRYQALDVAFLKRFGEHPDFFARAPGRVNLIGEHTDYSGYPVLPMAVRHDVVVAVAIVEGTSQLELAHLDDARYSGVTVNLADFSIDATTHAWSNYFLAGVKGLLQHARVTQPVGCRMMVTGNVPMGSGLSSSSALVCAAATAMMQAQHATLSPAEIAEMCRLAERLVGVEGGGMDQAISMLAERGKGKLIRFHPLSASDVVLPEGASFVVCHSMVESNKYLTASTNYNMRVAECRFASLLLANHLKLSGAHTLTTLRAVQELAGRSVSDMAALVAEVLHDTPYTVEEMAQTLGISADDVTQRYLRTSAGTPMSTPNAYLCRRRALHVFQETQRVFDFYDVCAQAAAGKLDNATALSRLGELMDASHFSCRDQFDVSCPELEALTTLARSNGALGSRLTGAGWGGCTVSLVRAADTTAFIEKMKQGYYASVASTENLVFASAPSGGAAIYMPRHGH